jgi:hypothetical protein
MRRTLEEMQIHFHAGRAELLETARDYITTVLQRAMCRRGLQCW